MGENLRIANEYANSSYLHPLVALLLAVIIPMILVRSRKAVLVSMLIVMNFVTSAQRISLAGVDLPIMRIVIILAVFRIIMTREYLWIKPLNLDVVIVIQMVISAIDGFLRTPSFSEMVYDVSTLIDSLGGYLIVRTMIRDREDFLAMVRALMWISFPIVLLFIAERLTGRNPMASFGGVAAYTWIREGKMRVQGPYPHVILAGALWATVVPLFLASAFRGGKKNPGMIAAAIAGLIIIVLCASSTPLMSVLAGLGAITLFWQRNLIVRLQSAALIGLVGLAAVWDHPIWYIVAKIDFTGGSTGWFRFNLIDQYIRRWPEWFAIGVRSTAGWGYGLIDVCNQYVSAGTNGGIIGLACFLASIAISFSYVGTLALVADDNDVKRDYWFLGASLLVHLMNFVGVSYFSHITFCWWLTLGFIGSLYQAKFGQREPRAIMRLPLEAKAAFN